VGKEEREVVVEEEEVMVVVPETHTQAEAKSVVVEEGGEEAVLSSSLSSSSSLQQQQQQEGGQQDKEMVYHKQCPAAGECLADSVAESVDVDSAVEKQPAVEEQQEEEEEEEQQQHTQETEEEEAAIPLPENPLPSLLEFTPPAPDAEAATSTPTHTHTHTHTSTSTQPTPTTNQDKQVAKTLTPPPLTSKREETGAGGGGGGGGLSGAAMVVGWGAGRAELERLYVRGFVHEDISLMEVVTVFGLEYLQHVVNTHRDKLRELKGGWCLPGFHFGGVGGGECVPNPVVRFAMLLVDLAKVGARKTQQLAIEWGVAAAQQVCI
jgi:hypothetical protein